MADTGLAPAARSALAITPNPLFRVGRSFDSVNFGVSLNVTGIYLFLLPVVNSSIGDLDGAGIVPSLRKNPVRYRSPLLCAGRAGSVAGFTRAVFGRPRHFGCAEALQSERPGYPLL